MRISATTTALHNAVAGSVSRAGVWSRARSVLLRSVAACLAVVAVQQSASAQWNPGTISGTYQWADTNNWVGGLITNTISSDSTTSGGSNTNPITFQMTGTTLTKGINFGPSGNQQLVTFQATTGTQTISLSSGTMLTVNNVANNSSSFSNDLVLDLAHSGTSVFNLPDTRWFAINSKITGSGALRLSAADNSNVFVSNSANDWTGGLILNAPTIFSAPVTGTFAPIAGSLTMESNGQLRILGAENESRFFIVNNLSGAAGSVSLSQNPNGQSATVAFNSTVSSTFAGGVLTASDGYFRNRATLNVWKQGSGTLSLTGNSTYYGQTSIVDGTLDIAKITDAGVTGTVTRSGTINTPSSMAGIRVGMQVWSQDGGVYPNVFVTATTATTFTTSGELANNTPFVMGFTENNLGISTSSASNLIFNGGRLRYSGSSSGSTNRLFSIGTGGGGIIADGTTGVLSFTGGGTIGFNGQTGARTFTLSGSNTGTNTLTTALADNGGQTALVKSGVGRWVLGGIHGYTGSTSIDSGSLLVNGTLGNTAVTVNSSGLLGGSGRINGSVSVLSGGTFSPGMSPGVLTLDSSLTLAGTTLMEIDGTTRATQYDGTDVAGALTYGGAMSIAFNSSLTSAYADNTEFDFFNFASQSGSFTSITTADNGAYYGGLTFTQTPGGDKWTATKTSQTLEFTQSTGNLVIVPEPLTLGLLGIGSGVACVGLRRLRRRSGGSATRS